MKVKLEPIKQNEDKTDVRFASDDCQYALKMWEEYYPKIGFHPPWIGYFTKLGDDIVGSCAFTGPPVESRVELSYWTFQQHEGRGISTAACRELIAIAKEAEPNIMVWAKTAPEKNASTSILEKCGFVFSGTVQDHEIGDAWEWILRRP